MHTQEVEEKDEQEGKGDDCFSAKVPPKKIGPLPPYVAFPICSPYIFRLLKKRKKIFDLMMYCPVLGANSIL
jgi:hypothetical protein